MIKNPIRLAIYLVAGWMPAGRRRCIMCGHAVWKFMPYRHDCDAGLMQALGVIGSDVKNFECPRCGAHDRERHLLMYLQASGLLAALPTMRILHFAPERHLSRRIAASAPIGYIRCDLYPASEEIERVDIEAMPFDDGAFDLVIANHVLEHVEDDSRALAEIYRVLKPGGAAILQTPYSSILHRTWSDPGIIADEARRQAYGQEDHVRLFGRDIFERFSSSGLGACIATHDELLAGRDARMLGVNPSEPFFLFRRDR
ncbi:SAM-dependent methyltransferase [Lysobacter niabensis]|uniref:SAM-dependent methyltransferase n=1 Tax=Agrilutibacter niabensis TaxID=380628 RepID=A0ABU1VK93_9GAMM|nr:methyltransferase domain-containing protein [Lysobacter niabensis]MDR7097745.1 SAM-dependent methyltransferase [Lysobacter niabensis]